MTEDESKKLAELMAWMEQDSLMRKQKFRDIKAYLELANERDATICQQFQDLEKIETYNSELLQELEQANKRIEALTNAGNDLIDSAGGSPKQQFRLSTVRWDNLLSNTKGAV